MGSGETIAVGVDCATEEARTGLALGTLHADGTLELRRVTLGTAGESAAATIAQWIAGAERYVIGLDAPLGWPAALGALLVEHTAGEPITIEAESMFRRETDRFVHAELGKHPLEVGADRIARTARAALLFLAELRTVSGLAVPLAWQPGSESGAIEVYPAATLLSRGISPTGYKGTHHEAHVARGKILSRLARELRTSLSRELLIENADMLDAAVCALAAADFARGQALAPRDTELAKKEGWIWFRGRGQAALF